MFVVTGDQEGSRTRGDRVPAALAALERPGLAGRVRGFERTAGDEIQAVFDEAAGVVDTLVRLTRLSGWRVGVGVGTVDTPLPPSTRAGTGAAFVAARRAVERARRDGVPVALDADHTRAGDAETALRVLASMLARRSARGWEAVDLVDAGATGAEAAALLRISASAVSQRLRSAEAELGARVRVLAINVLGEIRP